MSIVYDVRKDSWEFELPYPNHTGNHSVRHGGGSHYLTEGAKAYRALVEYAAVKGLVKDLQLAGPLEVSFLVAPPNKAARDTDNLLKVVNDAITKAGIWVDDSNKVIRRTIFEWTAPEGEGRILVTIKTLL
jgi:crossover junction endodeoxyribonuclease RusA